MHERACIGRSLFWTNQRALAVISELRVWMLWLNTSLRSEPGRRRNELATTHHQQLAAIGSAGGPSTDGLLVPKQNWLQPPGGRVVPLSRRRPQRRVLHGHPSKGRSETLASLDGFQITWRRGHRLPHRDQSGGLAVTRAPRVHRCDKSRLGKTRKRWGKKESG
jgi:hypothetical protein